MKDPRQMTPEERAAFQEQLHEFNKIRQEVHNAQIAAAITQNEIDKSPSRFCDFAVIVAVDQHRGIAKNGEIPWYYPEDVQWFKNHTSNHPCVMGRLTYEDINKRLGDKAKESVLPDRQCFVISQTLESLPNATVIKTLTEIEKHLVDQPRQTVFVIGGERLFREGISRANTVYLTVIDKDYECDKYFPVEYLDKHFKLTQTFKPKTEMSNELRFLVWTKK
jgi:dihydrofolate reductase